MILETRALTKFYNKRKVVDGVEMTISPSEIVGLLGRNGAGKTTTFKMVMGLVKPTSGLITFENQDITVLPVYRRARIGIGYLSQEPSVFQHLTAYKNILAVTEIANLRISREEILALFEEYNLTKVINQYAYTLSGGEKRRLEICRVLVLKPRLVLLDEPFSGLDPISVQEIHEIIYTLKRKGIAIFLTDHNVRETLTVTDKSFIINDGTIIAKGGKEEIINNQQVIDAYLGKNFAF
ncbi:MAG: LPS export ABC transporter ATP-binding protein [Planctomycetes bacterium]|nr:LPS export ABC transporter ATP-binding protein [Planctomycetota bacterium]